MIIKITFHDNDYEEVLEYIARDLEENLFGVIYPINSRNVSKEQFIEYVNSRQKYDELMHPNTDWKELTSEDKGFLLKIFNTYVNSKNKDFLVCCDDPDSYLLDNFTITLDNTFIEQWENGENLYFFTRSRSWLIQ